MPLGKSNLSSKLVISCSYFVLISKLIVFGISEIFVKFGHFLLVNKKKNCCILIISIKIKKIDCNFYVFIFILYKIVDIL